MIEYHFDIVQGTDEWHRIRHGMITASTFKNIITPAKLELSKAAATRLFYDDILSQRIDETIQPGYLSYDMMRGHEDEPYAVQQYEKEYNKQAKYCGFIINHKLGFPLGFSPDALIGDDGFVEIKSKEPKHQVKTILDHICGRTDDPIPMEHMIQVQAGLFITERDWCDFISFCNGNQMMTVRVEPIEKYQEAIEKAAIEVEKILAENLEKYMDAAENDPRLTLTPRRVVETEMVI